ncbi:flagellar hook protein FlgE [Pseudothauera nasutitermitis]|uniref:Flagellar hook protein FlgE n=1 Tax=Pseudothauera nasutitermitis TaxID=2565930 RepID=A0A4S4B062_9RHOO|nr:flagellar hook protein FlgE [Pseudothauera nasutitermitis]THF65726.1 flagellar hook protein FlgE [Pseudothauera nasutitermitis]
MAFHQGLSGLSSSSKALDTISHNVANASTVGFKSGYTVFGDLYASAMLGGSTSLQVGNGSQVTAVWQNFTQGNPTVTGNPLDMAISGNGFFRMMGTDGSIAYTRNGQFDVSRDGFIINTTGYRLTGYAVADANVSPPVFQGEPSVLYVDTTNVAPRETGAASVGVNLNSSTTNPLAQTPPGSDITAYLNATSIPVDSYNYTTSMTVYDSLGNASMLSMYFVRQSDPVTGDPLNTWDVYARLDNDVVPDPADPTVNTGLPLEHLGEIVFTEFGVPDTTVANNGVFSMSRTAAELATGADGLTFTLDLSRSTQWNSTNGVTTAPRQDGYTTGRLTGVSVNSSGILEGTYSNGQTKAIGKLALAEFAAPQGLTSLGGNMWAESYDSGEPAVGAPGTGVLGSVTSGQVEESNVDLTAELVNMIVQQRNYQANAQSIRTQDQLLQTLVNLR